MGFMRPLLRAARLAAALAAVVVVAACSGDSEATLLSSARGWPGQHDAKAAVIQLKTCCRRTLTRVRVLMGAPFPTRRPGGRDGGYRKAQPSTSPTKTSCPRWRAR